MSTQLADREIGRFRKLHFRYLPDLSHLGFPVPADANLCLGVQLNECYLQCLAVIPEGKGSDLASFTIVRIEGLDPGVNLGMSPARDFGWFAAALNYLVRLGCNSRWLAAALSVVRTFGAIRGVD